jgi:hypothetical protein
MGGRSGRSDTLIGFSEKGRGTDSRHAAGRTRSREGCSTILSTYNRSTTCWLHTEPAFRHPLYHTST